MLNGVADGDLLALLDPTFLEGFGTGGGRMLGGTGSVLPGVRRPMAIGLKTDEIRRMITLGAPEAL